MTCTEITDEVYQQYMEGIRAKERIIVEIRTHGADTTKYSVHSYHAQKKIRRSSMTRSSAMKASPSQKKKASRFT